MWIIRERCDGPGGEFGLRPWQIDVAADGPVSTLLFDCPVCGAVHRRAVTAADLAVLVDLLDLYEVYRSETPVELFDPDGLYTKSARRTVRRRAVRSFLRRRPR